MFYFDDSSYSETNFKIFGELKFKKIFIKYQNIYKVHNFLALENLSLKNIFLN